MARHRPTLPACLTTSLGLRVPVFARTAAPREKIEALEEYLLLSASVQGDLTEERFDWMTRLVPIQDEWDHMPEEEWGHHRRTRTETAVKHAKRIARPPLYDEIMDIEWMIKRLTEEIDRMERDATKCSRAYTMITGS